MSQPRLPPAPLKGAYTLSDETRPSIEIHCPKCGRAGRYSIARLMAEHGDIGLPDLLVRVSADCPERAKISGRCGAVYADPIGSRR